MLDIFRKQVIDACIDMTKKGLTVGTWGNISSRDPKTGNIFITPSGMDYDTCVPDDIIVYDREGNLVQGERKPTIEKDMHIGIYKKRPDVNVVVHSHPLYATVFAVVEQGIPAITEEFAQTIGKWVPCAKYALPGTMELAENTVEALEDGRAVLLTSQGAVCVGPDVKSAFRICEVLEKAALITIMAKSIGTPRIIPDQHVDIMSDFFSNIYGQR